ncbi:nuclear transport factor 2 family protein [Streptomyces mangrovisoli]|uniref:SnoaL-like domain-containing protein n=1 Tax=Streptomyces mangrovisoli TaxID=1428628 RepID=A0A1J4NT65_9ACTN|nr:nuclear transport factor 2 family protein [Streptomyces mangrovisoli]OIJ65496.1 hypothetical protein WN71_023405 [Streptomyces mangrovisoli]
MTTMEELALRMDRMEAVQACQNVMSTYQYLHSAYQNADIVDLFAERDDLVCNMPFGRWEGPDAARRCFGVMFEKELTARDRSGELVEHHLTTPIIEVAGDGMTAKGTWWSPGHEVHNFFWVDGSPKIEFWYNCRYEIDFVKTEKGWKFWHLNVHQIFCTEQGKTIFDGQPAEPPTPKGWGAPDEEFASSTTWAPDREPRLVPAPPKPYRTYGEPAAEG